jgi:predicted O-methyltransferase YrrM
MEGSQDTELDPRWLERLYSLNAVIAAVGEPLAGNLFYEHEQEDFARSPASPVYRTKRDRIRRAVAGRKKILEVGVNGGHSAFLVLAANPDLAYHGVDICEHAYVEPAVAWLEREFPGRVSFDRGDSAKVLPVLAARGHTFDAFHLDGVKYNYLDDILNSSAMVAPGGALAIVDDAETKAARIALSSLTLFGVVKSLPDFPPMSSDDPNRHEIKSLSATSPAKRGLIRPYSDAITLARRAKAIGWRESEWARYHRRSNLLRRGVPTR